MPKDSAVCVVLQISHKYIFRPGPSISHDEAGGWFHQDLICWCRLILIHEYIVKHSVKGMHPGLGVRKLVREFARFWSKSEKKTLHKTNGLLDCTVE